MSQPYTKPTSTVPEVFFEFRGTTFVVRRPLESGVTMYKDAAHLGGPWSVATVSLGNSSLHPEFRKSLRAASVKLVQMMAQSSIAQQPEHSQRLIPEGWGSVDTSVE